MREKTKDDTPRPVKRVIDVSRRKTVVTELTPEAIEEERLKRDASDSKDEDFDNENEDNLKIIDKTNSLNEQKKRSIFSSLFPCLFNS